MFIVQESVHGDHVSSHEAREDAVAAIEEMIRAGLAKPGEFNIREVDENGVTVGVATPSIPVALLALRADLPLTPRERQVLELLAAGFSQRETAKRLFISPMTVKVHVRHIRTKLEADAQIEAVAPELLEALMP